MNTQTLWQYIALAFLSTLISCSDHNSLRLGTTTTLEDSGLLSTLISQYQQETGINIKPIVAGSGHILSLIKRGDIDSAITHFPTAEEQLLASGTIDKRTPLMYNDFIIVGPATDPAHIALSLTPDEVFKKIINSGTPFVSRADNSGTYQMEDYWWQQSNIDPASDNRIKTGTGMGATLAIAVERKAYTLVDRATWLNFANKKDLIPLFENEELLSNQYSLLSFNHDRKNTVASWENWLLTGNGNAIIRNYKIQNQVVFFIN